jgi:hypothetical protein
LQTWMNERERVEELLEGVLGPLLWSSRGFDSSHCSSTMVELPEHQMWGSSGSSFLDVALCHCTVNPRFLTHPSVADGTVLFKSVTLFYPIIQHCTT